MFESVKKAIDEFNLYCLLPEAPSDEFDSESRAISKRINTNSTVDDIACIISEVLSNSFGEELKVKECIKTAEKIYNSIRNM